MKWWNQLIGWTRRQHEVEQATSPDVETHRRVQRDLEQRQDDQLARLQRLELQAEIEGRRGHHDHSPKSR